jgi:hypothetical protein
VQPQLCAIAITACVIAVSSLSPGSPLMKERSIFTVSAGKRFRYDSEE